MRSGPRANKWPPGTISLSQPGLWPWPTGSPEQGGTARRGQEQRTGKGTPRCFHEADLPAHLSRSDYHLRPFLLQEGFDALDPFVPILVPSYNPKEFESCIQYYLENDWLQHEKGR